MVYLVHHKLAPKGQSGKTTLNKNVSSFERKQRVTEQPGTVQSCDSSELYMVGLSRLSQDWRGAEWAPHSFLPVHWAIECLYSLRHLFQFFGKPREITKWGMILHFRPREQQLQYIPVCRHTYYCRTAETDLESKLLPAAGVTNPWLSLACYS